MCIGKIILFTCNFTVVLVKSSSKFTNIHLYLILFIVSLCDVTIYLGDILERLDTLQFKKVICVFTRRIEI